MLARSVMIVVFVPGEVISQGSPDLSGLTAEERPVSVSADMAQYSLKCHSDDVFRKRKKWNAVNPSSGKLKLGRGTLWKESNGKRDR